MAELSQQPYAWAFTLTYSDGEDGQAPLGAKLFRYSDVQKFWKRIRSAAKRKWGENLVLRFLVVGETGSRKGRVHYHGVIFASKNIVELGHWEDNPVPVFQFDYRKRWSLWPHGFLQLQRCDRKSVSYAIKYLLKGRMNAKQSQGFAREGKTEWLSSSYLWVSKEPALGEDWLMNKLSDGVKRGRVPSSLRIPVPGGGEWYLQGATQKKACLFLHEANNDFRQRTGDDLAGWRSLVASVDLEVENAETGENRKTKAWEWLTNGEEEEGQTREAKARIGPKDDPERRRLRDKQEIRDRVENASRIVGKCGNVRPCEACFASLSNLEREAVEREEHYWTQRFRQKNGKGDFARFWRTRLSRSKWCRNPKEDFDEAANTLRPRLKQNRAIQYRAGIRGQVQGKTE